jgi:hypothetical protein
VIVPGFAARPLVRELDRRRWCVGEFFVYDSAVMQAQILVPPGFVTDFASIPRTPLLWWLLGDRARGPALVHDFLYQTHLCDTRVQADAVFGEAMQAEGVSVWARKLMLAGVRLFGRRAWATGQVRRRQLGNDLGGAGLIAIPPSDADVVNP